MKFLILGLVILVPLSFFIFLQAISIVINSKQVDYHIQPFEKKLAGAKLKALFLGDSTVVGSGSELSKFSTAGWFSQDFPDASVENISQNGLKLKGLLAKLPLIKENHYNIVVVQIGANDIIRFTPYADINRDVHKLLSFLKARADQVVFLHSGDIGHARIFVWPFNRLITHRSYGVRRIYQKAALDTKTHYVDLISMEKAGDFSKNPDKYYASDHFHLSGEGYHFWYQAIRSQFQASLIDKAVFYQ